MSKIFKAKSPLKKEAKKPKTIYLNSKEEICENSPILNNSAPKITGIEAKKENLKAASLCTLRNSKAEIVRPERDKPGITEIPCRIPSQKASPIFNSDKLRKPLVNLFVQSKVIPVIKSGRANLAGAENIPSKKSSPKTTIAMVKIVAKNI